MKTVLKQGNFKKKIPTLEIHWDTILICQYKCSYCYARDRTDWFKFPETNSHETIIKALSKSHLPLKLGLLGGEPTIHPKYKEILQLWNDTCSFNETYNVPNTLYTSTNGVRDLDWFKSIPSYENMSFLWSFHPENSDNLSLEEKMKVMLSKGYECGINLMMLPAIKYRDKTLDMYNRCKNLGIEVVPTYLHIKKDRIDDSRVMLNYNEEFWIWVKSNFDLIKKDKHYIKIQGDAKILEQHLTEDEIFENRYNLFKGYSCMLNHYKINVDGTVNVLCVEDNRTCLVENNDYFKNIQKIQRFKCPLPACTCAELFEIPKIK